MRLLIIIAATLLFAGKNASLAQEYLKESLDALLGEILYDDQKYRAALDTVSYRDSYEEYVEVSIKMIKQDSGFPGYRLYHRK